MTEFGSAINENNEKIEALVTTLSQLVPGFEQAYGKNYADVKQRCDDPNKDPKQSLIADQLVETVRELAEDR